mgnify:CR=1 FL=1
MNSNEKSIPYYWKSKHQFFTLFLTLTLLLVFSKNLRSQFVYAGIGSQINSIIFNKIDDYGMSEFTRLLHFDIQASFVFRPTYRFAIGTSLALPVYQNSKFTLHEANALSGKWNDIPYSEFRGGYVPEELSYDFKSSANVSLFGRYYMDGIVNSYIQIGATFRRLEENFRLLQLNPGINQSLGDTDISFNESFFSVAPQIALGLSPQFGVYTDHPFFKRTYLDIYLAFAMVPAFSRGFEYIVPYNENSFENEVYRVSISDQTDGFNRQFSAGFSVGYVF